MLKDAVRKRVAVVEDDDDVRNLLTDVLSGYGYAVLAFSSGGEAQREIARDPPDLCIVDLGLPDMDGMTLVREFYDNLRYGVIILSGRGGVSDKVLGLEFGADDYIAKPFEPRELVARVKSVIRRSDKLAEYRAGERRPEVRFGSWVFDIGRFALTHDDGRQEALTAAEASLLLTLIKSSNRILSREQLQASDVWSDDSGFERSIDVRVSRIRKKIEVDQKQPKFIKTVYGAGYMFASDVSWLG